jgi:hypothetical protein
MGKEINLGSSTEGCYLSSYVDIGCNKLLGIHIHDEDVSNWANSVFINRQQVDELIIFLNGIKDKVGN